MPRPLTLDAALDKLLSLEQRWWSDRCRAQGLTTNQLVAMYALSRRRRMRMAHLARRLFLTPSAASTLIQRLEAQGLVERAPDPTDGRAVVATLTPAGHRLVAELVRRGRGHTAQLLAQIGPEQREHLLTGLTACAEALEQATPSVFSP